MDKAENIRLAISKEYRLANERKNKISRSIAETTRLLEDKSLPYNEYTAKMNHLEILKAECVHLNTEINTWDKAREICLKIVRGYADEG